MSAGVDRRGQAYAVRDALAKFRNQNGLTLKISQDAGASNQWREAAITHDWVASRRKQSEDWASGCLEIVNWLIESKDDIERCHRAEHLLEAVSKKLVQLAVDSKLDYPKFRATPLLAMSLVRTFVS